VSVLSALVLEVIGRSFSEEETVPFSNLSFLDVATLNKLNHVKLEAFSSEVRGLELRRFVHFESSVFVKQKKGNWIS